MDIVSSLHELILIAIPCHHEGGVSILCLMHRQCAHIAIYRLYAYDVTEGRPAALGVKRGTAMYAIAKHAARGPTPACHTTGLTRARALTERLSANAFCQHNTCAQLDPQHGVLLG